MQCPFLLLIFVLLQSGETVNGIFPRNYKGCTDRLAQKLVEFCILKNFLKKFEKSTCFFWKDGIL